MDERGGYRRLIEIEKQERKLDKQRREAKTFTDEMIIVCQIRILNADWCATYAKLNIYWLDDDDKTVIGGKAVVKERLPNSISEREFWENALRIWREKKARGETE